MGQASRTTKLFLDLGEHREGWTHSERREQLLSRFGRRILTRLLPRMIHYGTHERMECPTNRIGKNLDVKNPIP